MRTKFQIMKNKIANQQLNEEYSCEELIETMRTMMMYHPGEKRGYIPAYTRTDVTDALHENAGFRTDYEILSEINMKKAIRSSKSVKKTSQKSVDT